MRKSSVLQYSLAKAGPVELAIYSVDGRKVRTLAHGIQEVGRYRLTWDGADDRGEVMKSGVFFARLETAGLQKTRLIALVR